VGTVSNRILADGHTAFMESLGAGARAPQLARNPAGPQGMGTERERSAPDLGGPHSGPKRVGPGT